MSRFYEIVLGKSASGRAGGTLTSAPGGVNDPGALLVEMDIPVAAYDTPGGAAQIVISGVSIQTVAQGADFNGAPITVSGGMTAGLPLANPSQAGVLIQGQIYQAYGNWIGENMSLVFQIVQAGTVTTPPATPLNIVFRWLKGTSLTSAINTLLTTAFPGYTANINITPNLVNTEDEHGFHGNLTQFSQYLHNMSQSIIGPTLNGQPYAGVSVVPSGQTFYVQDGSSQQAPNTTYSAPKKFAFTDMIGQPTWIDTQTLQFNTVMRADITIGDYVLMPVGINPITTQPGAIPVSVPTRDSNIFYGTWQIVIMRHVGNSRDPSATAWVTTFNAIKAVAPQAAP